jgi:HK97 family phage major capsid protein
MKTIREMLDERAQLINQARALLDAADNAKRSLNGEEEQSYKRLLDQAEALKRDVDQRQRLEAAESTLDQAATAMRPEVQTQNSQRQAPRETPEYRQAYMNYLVSGAMNPILEQRDVSVSTSALGGYLLAPLQMVSGIIKAIDDLLFIRQFATIHTLTDAVSLGAPSLDADPADADWTTEVATVGVDSTMAFGRRELKPTVLTKIIKVSYRMLTRLPSAEAMIMQRLAYKFAVPMEKGYLTGSGTNQPLGLFTASANGISTGRDVSTGNTTTAITLDGLKEAKYSVKAQYRRNAKWLFNRLAVKALAKIKDGDGNYIWQPSLVAGQSDMLMGAPVLESEYVPSTFTTGLYVGLYGDISFYWIADSLGFTVQRLVELYAGNNQIGLKGMLESDGMPVLEEAFARVKLA